MKTLPVFYQDSLSNLSRRFRTLLGLPLLAYGNDEEPAEQDRSLDSSLPWILLPVQNHSASPNATEHVETILAVLLPNYGLSRIQPYSAPEGADVPPRFDSERFYENALSWARHHGFTFGITGSVDEWRYRTGAEGDAAVALNLQVINIVSGEVLWSSSGVRCGWGRETLKGTAQKLLRDLLATMYIRHGK